MNDTTTDWRRIALLYQEINGRLQVLCAEAVSLAQRRGGGDGGGVGMREAVGELRTVEGLLSGGNIGESLDRLRSLLRSLDESEGHPPAPLGKKGC